MTSYFLQAFIYLVAAVITVPIARRLGLGSVLGYLVAGVVIGPVLHLVGDETEAIQHFAEFGVVMMLFLVGLELEPKSLWAMKAKLFGLGGIQLLLTTIAITFIALELGQPFSVSLTIGLIFSLSSTAIVLQSFQEKGLEQTEGGKNAFSVLLFQDIAVIPMLALIPLLALPELMAAGNTADASAHNYSLVDGLPAWLYAIVIMGSVAVVTVGGHFLSRPLFKYVASSGLREIFTATSLMLMVGIAALMSLVGLSPALGAFLAGVMLANSEFRHELKSNIEPFKGLLLGLFFITVGAGIDMQLLTEKPMIILALTVGVMLIKAVILSIVTLLFRIQGQNRWLFSLSLAQAGEFGFVLLNFSSQNSVLPPELVEILSLVVAFSMFLTPALFILFSHVILPAYTNKSNRRQPDSIDDYGTVIIAGIGRFGQIVNRLLLANNIKTVVLDVRAEQIDNMRRIGTQAYFGDAARPSMLHTAGIDKASMLVIAINDKEAAIEIVKYVKHAFPRVKVLSRAFDRGHGYRLRQSGANFIVSETYHSALAMGAEALRSLGIHAVQAERQVAAYKHIEDKQSDTLYEAWLDDASGERIDNNYIKLFIQLEELIQQALKEAEQEANSVLHAKEQDPQARVMDKEQ
ncbi:monovalent cation:proton antiporter-2 (CPA2) family protein [Alteromonas confluentis]|uniref:Potassium transporter n=1 Tax=Alteromonas confluentis TaxID=1656094 RepID=A0A1E7ZAL9_9ALTE|nr:monovalent cation:proton antiporter-2 (CPA2) family protein [Alteromonas confluentis]OFC70560.1 potassium transporter [Alteromonas confluentis]